MERLHTRLDLVAEAIAVDATPAAESLLQTYDLLSRVWVLAPDRIEDVDVLGSLRDILELRRSADYDPHPYLWNAWFERSYVLGARQRYRDGIAFLSTILDHCPSDDPVVALLLIDLAKFHEEFGDFDAASSFVEQGDAHLATLDVDALVDRDRVNVRRARSMLDMAEADLFLRRGWPELAAEPIARARAGAEEYFELTGDTSLQLDALRTQIAIAMALDRFEQVVTWMQDDDTLALREASSSALNADAIALYWRRLSIRLGMAQVFLEHRDPSRPRNAARTLAQVEASMTAEDAVRERRVLAQWSAVNAIHEGRPDDALDALDRAAAMVGEDRADLTSILLEALRTRHALRFGDATDRDSQLLSMRAAFVDLVDLLGRREVADIGQGFLFEEDVRDVVSEYVFLLLDVHGRHEGASLALDELCRVQSVGSLARSLGSPPVNAVDARRLAPIGGGALLYTPGWDRSVVFAIESDVIRAVDLPPFHQLEQTRDALITTIEGSLFGDDPRLGPDDLAAVRSAAVDAFLPAALRDVIDHWRELVVVAPDTLGYLPLEALPWSADEQVGERFAVRYLPSFPVGSSLSARGDGRPPAVRADEATIELLVHVAPSSGSGSALSFGGPERKMLLDRWPLAPPRLTVGSEARRSLLTDPALTAHTALHIVAPRRNGPVVNAAIWASFGGRARHPGVRRGERTSPRPCRAAGMPDLARRDATRGRRAPSPRRRHVPRRRRHAPDEPHRDRLPLEPRGRWAASTERSRMAPRRRRRCDAPGSRHERGTAESRR